MLTRSKRLLDHTLFARFGAVGLVNTAIGYLVVVILLSLGAGDLPANAAGYAIGLTVSYFVNTKWTGSRIGARTALRYGALFIAAYGANLAIVLAGRALGYPENPLIHLAGVGVYAAVFYAGAVTFVFDDRPAASGQKALERHWPEILTLCAVAVAWLAMRQMPVSHDVVWQMWIARQLLGGASLYSEILELNPPLWFWLAMPVEKAAQWLGVVPKHAMVAAVFGYIVLAQLAFAALIAELSAGRRAVLLAVSFLAAVIVPIPDFAQREHLTLIAAIPYCALIARRAEGRDVPWRLALAIGLLCAIGFALKHYFVVVPALLELWLLRRRRKAWKPFRPETLALAGAAILYVTAIALVTPAFFTVIVPLVKLAYFGYELVLPIQLVKPFIVFWVFAAWALFMLRRNASPLTIAAAIAGAGFVLSYFFQQKGWGYHAMPASAMLFVALGSILAVEGAARSSLRIAAATMIMPMLIVVLSGPYRNINEKVIADLLTGTERGKPVMMLAVNPSRLWPMNDEGGYLWPSRHFAIWQLAAFAHQLRTDGRLSPEMNALAREVRAQTVLDLSCNPPDLIIADDLVQSKARGIDVVAFFSEDEEFRALFANYERARSRANFTTYVRRPDAQATPRPAVCRTVY